MMLNFTNTRFDAMCAQLNKKFLEVQPVHTGEWQSQDISDKPMLATRELLNVSFEMPIAPNWMELATQTGANLPWAEDHFQERVSGMPLNPPPSNAWWPYAQQGNADHKKGEKFSHTYPERMWPKYAGDWDAEHPADSRQTVEDRTELRDKPLHGIYFEYGDLADVVKQLQRGPLTRQAYLPIWFPEDTGAVHGERVPCTLGYHFLIRQGRLQITYYIRSCDYIRHFRDDVYMAGRLAQWVASQLEGVEVGNLYMHIVSFHIFEGDVAMMREKIKQQAAAESSRLMGLL